MAPTTRASSSAPHYLGGAAQMTFIVAFALLLACASAQVTCELR